MDRVEGGMNHVAMAVINPQKEYWPSRGSNKQPVLKPCILLSELWGVTQMTKMNATIPILLKLFFDRLENIVGKGENAGYQCFIFFSTIFSKGLFPGVVKDQHQSVNPFPHNDTF